MTNKFWSWLKSKISNPPVPGLPKDARPINNAFEVNWNFKDRKEFIERVYRIKIPSWIKTQKQWDDFRGTREWKELLDASETLTKEEIDKHTVRDWDYLVRGMNVEDVYAVIARRMGPYLQKDGDYCLLPQNDYPGLPMGLRNEKGKIIPFIAHTGEDQWFQHGNSARMNEALRGAAEMESAKQIKPVIRKKGKETFKDYGQGPFPLKPMPRVGRDFVEKVMGRIRGKKKS